MCFILTFHTKERTSKQWTKIQVSLHKTFYGYYSIIFCCFHTLRLDLPPLLQLHVIWNIMDIFVTSFSCSKHFTTLLSDKCNKNLGYVTESGWDFPETSHMVLSSAINSLPTVWVSLYTPVVQSWHYLCSSSSEPVNATLNQGSKTL